MECDFWEIVNNACFLGNIFNLSRKKFSCKGIWQEIQESDVFKLARVLGIINIKNK